MGKIDFKFEPPNRIIFAALPEIDHLSFSSLSNLADSGENLGYCDLKFWLYFMKIVQPETEEQKVGRAFHRLAEFVGGGMSYADALSAVTKELGLDSGHLSVLEDIWKGWYSPEKFRNIIAVEKYFEIEVNGIKLVGYIDAVKKEDDIYILIDYKTGTFYSWNMAKTHLQLDLYAYVWFISNREVEKVKTIYDFTDGSRIVREYSRADLPRLEKVINGLVGRVKEMEEKKEVKANPGTACYYCPAMHICPAFDYYINNGIESPLMNKSVEDLEKIYAGLTTQLNMLQKKVDSIKNLLISRLTFEPGKNYWLGEQTHFGRILVPLDRLLQRISTEGRDKILNGIKLSGSVLKSLPPEDQKIILPNIEITKVPVLKKKNQTGNENEEKDESK